MGMAWVAGKLNSCFIPHGFNRSGIEKTPDDIIITLVESTNLSKAISRLPLNRDGCAISRHILFSLVKPTIQCIEMLDPERVKLTERLKTIERNRAISIKITIRQDPTSRHAFIGSNRIVTYHPQKGVKIHKGKWILNNFLFPRLLSDGWKLWEIPSLGDALQGFGACSPFSGLSSVITCQNCGNPIKSDDHRRRYCSEACKREAFKKERRAPIWIHKCPNCHKTFTARDKAIFCSHRCRMQYKRKK